MWRCGGGRGGMGVGREGRAWWLGRGVLALWLEGWEVGIGIDGRRRARERLESQSKVCERL